MINSIQDLKNNGFSLLTKKSDLIKIGDVWVHKLEGTSGIIDYCNATDRGFVGGSCNDQWDSWFWFRYTADDIIMSHAIVELNIKHTLII